MKRLLFKEQCGKADSVKHHCSLNCGIFFAMMISNSEKKQTF